MDRISSRIKLSEAIESNRLTGDPTEEELEEMRDKWEEILVEERIEYYKFKNL